MKLILQIDRNIEKFLRNDLITCQIKKKSKYNKSIDWLERMSHYFAESAIMRQQNLISSCCIIFRPISIIIHQGNHYAIDNFKMFSLEITIQEFHQLHKIQQQQRQERVTLTLRWGSVQTDLELAYSPIWQPNSSQKYHGGKKLLLELTYEQIQSLLFHYAFGIFTQNHLGRFFSLLSLNSIQINKTSQFGAKSLYFYNDNRKPIYTYDINIKITQYNPKVPHTVKRPSQNIPIRKEEQANKKMSFLYGNRNAQCARIQPHAKPNKSPSAKVTTTKPKKLIQKQQVPHQHVPTKNIHIEEDRLYEESDAAFPPMMQFTNNEDQISNINKIPRIETFSNFEDLKETQSKPFNKRKQNVVPQYTIASSDKKNQNQVMVKQRRPTREQLRELAIREASINNEDRKKQVMLPILKGNTYQLVPISQISHQQIVEYAQKQKLAEEYEKQKKKMEKEREMEFLRKQKKRQRKQQQKLDQQALRKYQRQLKGNTIGLNKHSKKISEEREEESESSSMIEELKPQQINSKKVSWQQEQNSKEEYSQFEDQYSQDFESLSNAGSLFRSRASLQSSIKKTNKNNKNSVNISDISQSLDDYGYSQDFDSFSQSHMSRNKRASSISQISGSYGGDYRK